MQLGNKICFAVSIDGFVNVCADACCGTKQLQAMEQRFQVAVLLEQGLIYNDILEQTGASSATISRVNRSLQYGSDGYSVVFERLGLIPKKDEQ